MFECLALVMKILQSYIWRKDFATFKEIYKGAVGDGAQQRLHRFEGIYMVLMEMSRHWPLCWSAFMIWWTPTKKCSTGKSPLYSDELLSHPRLPNQRKTKEQTTESQSSHWCQDQLLKELISHIFHCEEPSMGLSGSTVAKRWPHLDQKPTFFFKGSPFVIWQIQKWYLEKLFATQACGKNQLTFCEITNLGVCHACYRISAR